MRFEPINPPRTFTVGANRDLVIRHCADVALLPDEQVTFLTDSGTEYDVVRKSWGYYACPSTNGRLREKGLRAALVRNASGKLFVLLVEAGREAEFEAYLGAEKMSVESWLDRSSTSRSLRCDQAADSWRHRLLPPVVQRWLRRRVIRRRIRAGLTMEEAKVLGRNESLRGRFAGRRCFVIGNGPSLEKVDLTPLGSEITIVMNSFNRHPILKQWKPTVYCRAEPPNSYDSPGRIATITDYTKGIDAQAYFFPLGSRALIERHVVLPAERLFYFKPVADLQEWPVEAYPLDLAGPSPHAGNTAHLAIMAAVHLGCSTIHLLGMDHDWLAHRSVNRHFYPPSVGDRGGEDDLGAYTYTTMMQMTLREWRRYEALKALATRAGSTIINATEGSFLDVFPTAELGSLLASRQPAASKGS
jgi:hypothetical protein